MCALQLPLFHRDGERPTRGSFLRHDEMPAAGGAAAAGGSCSCASPTQRRLHCAGQRRRLFECAVPQPGAARCGCGRRLSADTELPVRACAGQHALRCAGVKNTCRAGMTATLVQAPCRSKARTVFLPSLPCIARAATPAVPKRGRCPTLRR